jgi:hypothetical protein
MEFKDLIEAWYVDLVASGLGVALIVWSFEIRQENPYWWIAFFSGIIFNIPTLYFQIWRYIEEKFNEK